MTQDETLRLFEYRDGRLRHRTASRGRKIGDPIGSINGTGYRRVGIGGKYYTEHALVYLMHHGCIPAEIDHINGIRDDNRIENLRAVTRSQNQYNKGKCRNNTSGHRGVSWHAKTKKWAVRISLNNRNKSMGYYNDPELAAFIAEEARLKYYGQYAQEASHV
jgi:hypothetical protein